MSAPTWCEPCRTWHATAYCEASLKAFDPLAGTPPATYERAYCEVCLSTKPREDCEAIAAGGRTYYACRSHRVPDALPSVDLTPKATRLRCNYCHATTSMIKGDIPTCEACVRRYARRDPR